MTLNPRKLRNSLWIVRAKRRVGRKRLASLLGYRDPTALARWECGSRDPSLRNALALAYVLRTPVEMLFDAMREDVIRTVEDRERGDDDDTTDA